MFGRLPRLRVALLVSAVLTGAAFGCSRPPDEAYYLAHANEREAKLTECRRLYNPSSDAQCRAALEADHAAVAAEHGPPFHGHDAAWYRSHMLQQVQETGYCASLGERRTEDPDCVAASKGSAPQL